MDGLNLRDFLLKGLSGVPGTREFFIHVLVSSPRKFNGLFPFARPRPRAYLQDILVLLSEQATPESPRILVTAIEASVYNIPTTSCAILYISKVDSTGQAASPSPTPFLVRSLLSYYADPETRPISASHLWIHLFARAQSQYLFPNSADFSGKRPLSDVKLCAWWKRVLTEVVDGVKKRTDSTKLYYVLPGYTQLEAEQALMPVSPPTSASTSTWNYGHPYTQTEIPLPCPPPPDKTTHNLGHYIPTFDDDPKSRFMDEIGCDEEVIRSPPKKRARISVESDVPNKVTEKEVSGELAKVSSDDFWERMSFRQECVAGAVTGFFIAAISCSSKPEISQSPLAPSPGQVSSQLNKRILTSLMTGLEFSTVERAIKATESLEGSIKGLCERPVTTSRIVSDRQTPEPEPRMLLAPPSTPPPRRRPGSNLPDISPNPFPEPVNSLETFESHIYGSIRVKNAAQAKPLATAGNTPVTVLAVRKKKKPGA
ncbi:hypothetical protein MIND_00853700 [Mycena indigotica]|uniref:histone acetyltransferase n=1 Tax=Mycena indigotica TaxID=2126181 RepID=A0A8H6VYQ1_9AGAR|nr:uncharacterized protein MIND_00853700 [Mycena indigotica]KAF7299054.1 hypothetical protein MIND_00853700 [Mycena indigotica]